MAESSKLAEKIQAALSDVFLEFTGLCLVGKTKETMIERANEVIRPLLPPTRSVNIEVTDLKLGAHNDLTFTLVERQI